MQDKRDELDRTSAKLLDQERRAAEVASRLEAAYDTERRLQGEVNAARDEASKYHTELMVAQAQAVARCAVKGRAESAAHECIGVGVNGFTLNYMHYIFGTRRRMYEVCSGILLTVPLPRWAHILCIQYNGL